jgi:hypothetical protein
LGRPATAATYRAPQGVVPAFLRDALADQLARPLPGVAGPDAFIFTTPDGAAIHHNLFYKRVFEPTARDVRRSPAPLP